MLYIHSALFFLSLLVCCSLLPQHFAIGASLLCLSQSWLFLRLSAPLQKSYFGGLAHLPLLVRALTDNAHDYRLNMAASVRRLFRGYNSYALALIMLAIFWLCSRDILLARLTLPHALYAASLLFVLLNALLIGSVQKHPLPLAALPIILLVSSCAYVIWTQSGCAIKPAYPPTEGYGLLTSLAYLGCDNGTNNLTLFKLLLFGGGFISSLSLLLALAAFFLRASYSKSAYIAGCFLVAGLWLLVSITPYDALLATLIATLLAAVTGLVLGAYVLSRTSR